MAGARPGGYDRRMARTDHSGVLIVGGSAEARRLARALPGAQVRLGVPERLAAHWPVPPVTGVPDAAALRDMDVRAVIEAGHPCDAALASQVASACAGMGLPHLQVVRPAWREGRRDRWVSVRRARDVAAVIPVGARVFATLGRGLLPELRRLDAMVLARVIGEAERPFPLRHGRFTPGDGPFSLDDEIRLLRGLRIDWLVLRNAGGPGGWPKLAAARALGLPVAMVARPARPPGPRVGTVEEALRWTKSQVG